MKKDNCVHETRVEIEGWRKRGKDDGTKTQSKKKKQEQMVMEKRRKERWKERITARTKEKRKRWARKGENGNFTSFTTPGASSLFTMEYFAGSFNSLLSLSTIERMNEPNNQPGNQSLPLFAPVETRPRSFAKSRRGKNRKRLKAPGRFYADTFFHEGRRIATVYRNDRSPNF